MRELPLNTHTVSHIFNCCKSSAARRLVIAREIEIIKAAVKRGLLCLMDGLFHLDVLTNLARGRRFMRSVVLNTDSSMNGAIFVYQDATENTVLSMQQKELAHEHN